MLAREELERISRLKRLSLQNCEKDYLQEIILFVLYSKAKSELVFKGGTCLYKIFKLNRFSEDLDFTYTGKKNLRRTLDKVPSDLALLNINSAVKEIKEFKSGMNVRLLVNGPLYNGSKATQSFIPLNISMKENVVLEPKMADLTPLYTEIPSFGVFAMQEKEILAEKVRAILTRDKPRDIYDLWFLLAARKAKVSFQLINKKLKLYKLEFDSASFKKAVARKKRMWESDLKGLTIGELPPFQQVEEEVLKKMAES